MAIREPKLRRGPQKSRNPADFAQNEVQQGHPANWIAKIGEKLRLRHLAGAKVDCGWW